MAEKNGADERRPRFMDYVTYAAARLFGTLLLVLPFGLAARMGRCVGWLLFTFDKRHRLGAIAHVKTALGESMSDKDAEDIVRGMYAHFGTMLAEFVRIPHMAREEFTSRIDWNGLEEEVHELLKEGNGVILATGHIGVWEMFGVGLSATGLSSGAVARPLNNPLLDAYIKRVRACQGQEIWDKFGALRHCLRVLKNKESFGILIDQDGGKRGEFVPFFGKDASTITTVADLAVRTGAPVIAVALHRASTPRTYTICKRPMRRIDPSGDPQDERRRLLCTINDDLADIIREAPEQWLWLHRRWKTRPPQENATPVPVAEG